ncbi:MULTISPECIES: methyltransferase domain-containing protein [Clostridium]|uniref:Methyltransferase domain-containing protein n=1 Tax=Clostridium faecium TaxID=2762223 RepID=A0ABR8YUF8_9CLOT|nr:MULTISPECIES: methyltransferase domain-containing protein [Clostridium]MBD8047897.1 methyltransferase domain-containing protein [Clostridium faecium]
MHKRHINLFQCPLCHGELKWDIKTESKDRVINAKITCLECNEQYEVKDEIAIFLTSELSRNDLWQQGESGIEKCFRENPEIFNKLMNTPEEKLNGADHFFKASYFEIKRDYERSSKMFKNAVEKVYTKDYIYGMKSQREFVINNIVDDDKVIVDIASGKGYLVEELLNKRKNYILATDFSPTILLRNKEYYKFKGLYDKLSLIAFDARKTPFKDNAIEIMTSYVGIQNVEKPGEVISEMYRICKDEFMSVMHFIDENDKANMDFIKEFNSTAYATRSNAIETFKKCGWKAEIMNSFIAEVKPTPKGEILEGASIDGIPVEDSRFEFGVVLAVK